MKSDSEGRARPPRTLAATVHLSAVRDDLAQVEALKDEVRHRRAHLRATLPAEQFRLVWALLDAEERLGHAGRLLAEQWLVERLAERLPDHAATIRAEARRLSDGEIATADGR